jgi:hypothetical protein
MAVGIGGNPFLVSFSSPSLLSVLCPASALLWGNAGDSLSSGCVNVLAEDDEVAWYPRICEDKNLAAISNSSASRPSVVLLVSSRGRIMIILVPQQGKKKVY